MNYERLTIEIIKNAYLSGSIQSLKILVHIYEKENEEINTN